MTFEDNIFKRYSPDFENLKFFGFKKQKQNFIIEKHFKENLFSAVIVVTPDGKVSGTVYDLENNDEFLPLRVENSQGAFVGEVRAAYEELLEDIRDKCFVKKYYIFPQANRITNEIINKYGDEPEFLWKISPGSGVFRNPENKKWYLAILDVDRSKLQAGTKGLVEVADIKLAPEKIEKFIKEKHFYPAYHMNKKHWFTICLDGSVHIDEIKTLIDESYQTL